jgi:hypothetical protein
MSGSIFHAQTAPKIKHVLVISIDGMHSQDLDKWVRANPNSTLASLSGTGITYPNAYTTQPSDSIPSTVGIFTGASPSLAGMYYDDAWHRAWAPSALKGTCTPGVFNGTLIDLKQGIDKNETDINAGGGIEPTKLPRDPFHECAPVYPHNMIRVNTIFEVARAAGMYTAYSEKRPAYDFLNGPSGTGVQDLYTPEIAALNLLDPSQIQGFDQLRVDSILKEIRGWNHDGTAPAPVPAIFGMNFQLVNSAKKSSVSSGYSDSLGNFDSTMLTAMNYVDTAIGSMVSALEEQDLQNQTVIVITAKHGESPISNTRTIVLTTSPAGALTTAIKANKITTKTSALIWLKNQSQTAAAVAALRSPTALPPDWAANVSQVLSSGDGLPFPDPTIDPAVPDIVAVMKNGVNFEPSLASNTYAEHGGFGENETHVALLVAYKHWKTGTTISTPVLTRQIAPTVLALLGLDPADLQAVQEEHIPVLQDVLTKTK